MRVLLDSGVFIHSDFAKDAIKQTPVHWGGTDHSIAVHGLVGKTPDANTGYQRQKEALFTVGRLIREGRIEAFDYWEIRCEIWRGAPSNQVWNALRGCKIQRCCSPIERSKFRKTLNLTDVFSKGGRGDLKRGTELGNANQIAFFKWLCALTQPDVDVILKHQSQILLTGFEIESLKNIRWFRFLCERSQSPENYPDVFHLWTAERNDLDAVLTLDNTLPNIVANLRSEKKKPIQIRTEVLRPLELLHKFGIDKPDPVPFEANRFYHLHELT